MLVDALRKGIQVETHAIGDKANRFILDEYASGAESSAGGRSEKLLIRAGASSMRRSLIRPTFRVSPSSESFRRCSRRTRLAICSSRRARVGIDRLAGSYAWESLIKSGVVVPGGSDAPVERGEPMIEFYAAVARKDQKGFSGEGWHPEEAVTREQALKMFTIWPAYAAFEEKLRGTIEVGKLADLTILSADIMKIPEAEILEDALRDDSDQWRDRLRSILIVTRSSWLNVLNDHLSFSPGFSLRLQRSIHFCRNRS